MRKALTPISIANLKPRNARYEVPDGGCRGLYVAVQTSGTRSFVVRYRFRGQNKKLTLGPALLEGRGEILAGATPVFDSPLTLADARWLATQALRDVRGGTDPAAAKQAQRHSTDAEEDTVQRVADAYLKRHTHLRSLQQRAYDLGLINANLGPRLISSIKRSDLVRLLDKIEETNGPGAADRVAASWSALATWHASRSDDFKPPLIRGAKRNKAGARSRVLTDDELRRVWAAAERHPRPFGKLVQFLLLTGARRNEAAGIRRSELVDPATWVLPAARCKIKQDILLPLSKTARRIVDEARRIGDGDLVFTTDGKRPSRAFSREKKLLDEASGVTGWTIHDLRRTARTLLSRAGVDADIAERCLGHVIRGVRGTYDRHQYEDEKRAAFEALAALLDRILNPPAANVVALADAR
jgi:integrase